MSNPYVGLDPNTVTTSRDEFADCDRDGTNYKGRAPYAGTSFQAATLQQEADQEGWTAITKPVGGVVSDASTAGTRGAVDERFGDPDSPASGVEQPG